MFIAARVEGEVPTHVGFKVRYLRELVEAIDDGEREVKLEVTGEVTPVKVAAGEAGDAALHVVMPMKL